MKIHPAYHKGQAVYVTMPAAPSAWSRACCRTTTRRATSRPCRPSTPGSPTRTAAPRPTSSACRSPRPRANAQKIDWASYAPPKPTFTGIRTFRTYDVADLIKVIDWTPFFQTWELKGRFPAILQDEKQGEAARQLWEDAQAMLKRIVEERWFNPKAVIGFWPANAVGDDIRLFTGESRKDELATFFGLRQQLSKRDGRPNLCLSDFVAPVDSGKADWLAPSW